MNETVDGTSKSMKAAFEPFNQKHFHKTSHVFLRQSFSLRDFVLIIQKRCVTSVFELLRNELDGFVEDVVFFIV